jgi:hypothetical protein
VRSGEIYDVVAEAEVRLAAFSSDAINACAGKPLDLQIEEETDLDEDRARFAPSLVSRRGAQRR